MVSALAFNSISLCFPLFTETCSFLVLTYRTVSLLAINFIKWMSIFAMRFHGIPRTYCTRVFKGVLARCNESEVRRFNAISIFANMVDKHTIRYFANMYKICHSMSSTKFFSKIKRPVTVPVKSTLPKMTTIVSILNNKLTIKSFKFCLCYHNIPIVPCNTLRRK
nr:MAG TPA: hypothetical protein [Caudoviricetes sp.]